MVLDSYSELYTQLPAKLYIFVIQEGVHIPDQQIIDPNTQTTTYIIKEYSPCRLTLSKTEISAFGGSGTVVACE